MDYKEKYEQALERAKKFYNRELYAECNGSLVEYIFPELKECEDEKVRKWLIDWANTVHWSEQFSVTKEQVLAWLEKQGEQPNKVSIWKHWNNGIAGNGEGKLVYLIKNGSTYSLSSCLGFECDYIELSELDSLTLERQSEQKPADISKKMDN